MSIKRVSTIVHRVCWVLHITFSPWVSELARLHGERTRVEMDITESCGFRLDDGVP